MNAEQIRRTWDMLAQSWGARFVDQFGADPNPMWVSMLGNVDTDAALHAVKRLILSGSPHPPTLPEFVAAAMSAPRVLIRYDANGNLMP